MKGIQWRVSDDGREAWLSGELGENADLTPLFDELADEATLDLSGISRVSSFGVKIWVQWLRELCAERKVTFVRCASVMVRQFGMVPTTLGEARVASVMLPYYCDDCGEERESVFELCAGTMPESIPDLPCEDCGGEMQFDDVPAAYFSFLDDQNAALLSGSASDE